MVGRNRAGDPLGVEAVDRFAQLRAEAGDAEGGEGVGRQAAEQLGGIAGGRFLAGEVAAEVDLHPVLARQDAGESGGVAGVDPGPAQDLPGLRINIVPRPLDQAADVEVDVGEAALGGPLGGAHVAVFAAERVAGGGVDDELEDLLVFGEDQEVADEADRIVVVGLDLVVDALVARVLGLVVVARPLVDESRGRIGVRRFGHEGAFGRLVAFETSEEDTGPVPQPWLDFPLEVERLPLLVRRRFGEADQVADGVLPAGDRLGHRLGVRPQLAARLHRAFDEEDRARRHDADRLGGGVVAGAAAGGDRDGA